jgi:serine/threonine-protein kinase RsbW
MGPIAGCVPMRDTTESLTIVLPRITAKLDCLRETLVDFLMKHRIDMDIVARIELSVYEAVVNIIEHGAPPYRDRDVRIECAINNSEAVITIYSHGDKFDLTRVDMPDIEAHYSSGKKRGLGIYFIRTLMDRVEYHYHDCMNVVIMAKSI